MKSEFDVVRRGPSPRKYGVLGLGDEVSVERV
jgi:hypothetical protein